MQSHYEPLKVGARSQNLSLVQASRVETNEDEFSENEDLMEGIRGVGESSIFTFLQFMKMLNSFKLNIL